MQTRQLNNDGNRRANGLERITGEGGRRLRPMDDAAIRLVAQSAISSEELQNGLCLFAPIPEKTSDFLRTTVEACLKEVMKTVSGQFITHNTENDQYYLP